MDVNRKVINSVEFKVSDLPLGKEELEVVTMLLEGLDFKDMSCNSFTVLPHVYITPTLTYCYYSRSSEQG